MYQMVRVGYRGWVEVEGWECVGWTGEWYGSEANRGGDQTIPSQDPRFFSSSVQDGKIYFSLYISSSL